MVERKRRRRNGQEVKVGVAGSRLIGGNADIVEKAAGQFRNRRSQFRGGVERAEPRSVIRVSRIAGTIGEREAVNIEQPRDRPPSGRRRADASAKELWGAVEKDPVPRLGPKINLAKPTAVVANTGGAERERLGSLRRQGNRA